MSNMQGVLLGILFTFDNIACVFYSPNIVSLYRIKDNAIKHIGDLIYIKQLNKTPDNTHDNLLAKFGRINLTRVGFDMLILFAVIEMSFKSC